jgi:hypothetical protein
MSCCRRAEILKCHSPLWIFPFIFVYFLYKTADISIHSTLMGHYYLSLHSPGFLSCFVGKHMWCESIFCKLSSEFDCTITDSILNSAGNSVSRVVTGWIYFNLILWVCKNLNDHTNTFPNQQKYRIWRLVYVNMYKSYTPIVSIVISSEGNICYSLETWLLLILDIKTESLS